MRVKAILKFTKDEGEIVLDFCRQLQMPLDKFCKQAVFYAITDSNRRLMEMQKQGVLDGKYNTTDGVDKSDTQASESSSDVNSSSLSNSDENGDQATTGSEQV